MSCDQFKAGDLVLFKSTNINHIRAVSLDNITNAYGKVHVDLEAVITYISEHHPSEVSQNEVVIIELLATLEERKTRNIKLIPIREMISVSNLNNVLTKI